ncbi:MAG: hypothetical protein HC794_04760 [Nitrospiraceae bacterium]|nr:hypothetical protein [Nitrospiraceae bacterium]
MTGVTVTAQGSPADTPLALVDPTVGLKNRVLALQFADRIVAMRSGRVVLDMPTSGIDGRQLERIYADADPDEDAVAQPRIAAAPRHLRRYLMTNSVLVLSG